MKIACFSDNHGKLNFEVPQCDLLLIAGDMCGSSDIFEQMKFLNGPFYRFLEEVVERTGCKILLVPGNHDWIYEKAIHLVPEFPNTTTLIDKGFESEVGLIYGTPFQPIFFDWAFNLSEESLERKWAGIPEETRILLLHGPPYGILDKTVEGLSVGSPSLTKRISELKNLELVVTGHIHNSYGIEKRNFGNKEVTFINCSLCGEDYKLTRKPITHVIN